MNDKILKNIYNIREELAKIHYGIESTMKETEIVELDDSEPFNVRFKELLNEMAEIDLELIRIINRIEADDDSFDDVINVKNIQSKMNHIKNELEIMLIINDE